MRSVRRSRPRKYLNPRIKSPSPVTPGQRTAEIADFLARDGLFSSLSRPEHKPASSYVNEPFRTYIGILANEMGVKKSVRGENVLSTTLKSVMLRIADRTNVIDMRSLGTKLEAICWPRMHLLEILFPRTAPIVIVLASSTARVSPGFGSISDSRSNKKPKQTKGIRKES